MDNNSDDHAWMYDSDQWMDSSLFYPISDDDEPMINLILESTGTPATEAYSSLVNCFEEGEIAFLAFPYTSPSPQLPPPPSSLPLTSTVTAGPLSSPPPSTASGSRIPKGRKRRTIRKTKDKPVPKHMLDPYEPGITEKERQRRIHAKKCKQERLKKDEEKKLLKEEHDRLVNEVTIMTEKLQAERVKIAALNQELERRGHVILALCVYEPPA